MNFCKDKSIRHFCLYLISCVLLLSFFGIWLYGFQASAVQDMFLEHDRAIASSLLEQGVSKDIIANAITNSSGTQAGAELLNQIGITENTAVRFLPFIEQLQQKTAPVLLLDWSVFAMLLLSGVLLFFRKREQLYSHTLQVIRQYIDGDFSGHLSQTSEGTIYQLFSSVDQLATMLKSRNDTQESVKIFLKNTISDVSHQLKTPLAALSMYNEIILNEPDNVETVKNYSDKTSLALNRMEILIKSMLKITRMDAGGITFTKEHCDVTDLIIDSVRDLRTRAESEGKQIIIDDSANERLLCDIEWTSEAISNIVKNALDHTGHNGVIHISWERSPAMLRIYISDNGTGIAPEDIHHIFKRFYRSRNSLDMQGVGLGLSLAKSIIEGQGGIISVQSQPNEGTTFTLSFLTELQG